MAKRLPWQDLDTILTRSCQDIHGFLGVGKSFRLLYAIVSFFSSQPSMKISNFPNNGPYDFQKILHSHSTPKDSPACANAIKSYGWDVRNIAKINPEMAKKQPFFDFFDFRKNCTYDSTKIFYSLFVHHNMVLRVQFYQNLLTGIGASPKEKDLSRLHYRICGCGNVCH